MISKDEIKKYLPYVLEKTDFQGLGERFQGKVRDVYIQPERIILVSSDRYSAFDRNLALVPFKGAVLNLTSAFWFDATKDIIQNHLIDLPDPNAVVVKKCKVLPAEVVVRGYMTGVTGTSIWTLYQKGERNFGGITLPEGMKKNMKLPEALLTPTTKSDEHDEPITGEEIVQRGIVEEKLWNEVAEKAFALFARGQEIAESRGLILVDTKYEFGIDENGALMLIDEIHTPDSSRYWQKATYEARIAEGLEPENFDKEFLRLWFKDNCDPYKDATLPQAPEDLILTLSERYIQIYEQITGKQFPTMAQESAGERIKNNLKKYEL